MNSFTKGRPPARMTHLLNYLMKSFFPSVTAGNRHFSTDPRLTSCLMRLITCGAQPQPTLLIRVFLETTA